MTAMMRPVKLSRRKARKNDDTIYYAVSIPKEIGDRFAHIEWFICDEIEGAIVLRPAASVQAPGQEEAQ